MQTFLPYANFAKSAEALDRQRLGKQRVEALQILLVLVEDRKAWRNHPAVKMWRGYEASLASYGLTVCHTWILRGYEDTCYDKIFAAGLVIPLDLRLAPPKPPWLSNEAFHAAHRSNLLRKDPVFYGKFGWTEPETLPYVWPVA